MPPEESFNASQTKWVGGGDRTPRLPPGTEFPKFRPGARDPGTPILAPGRPPKWPSRRPQNEGPGGPFSGSRGGPGEAPGRPRGPQKVPRKPLFLGPPGGPKKGVQNGSKFFVKSLLFELLGGPILDPENRDFSVRRPIFGVPGASPRSPGVPPVLPRTPILRVPGPIFGASGRGDFGGPGGHFRGPRGQSKK